MYIDLKETNNIQPTQERLSWVYDPAVNEYIFNSDPIPEEDETNNLTRFHKYYEIYQQGQHVGDIKVFYETEEDILKKRAQILMVVGNRNKGIGTDAINLLLDRLKGNYYSVYCNILRSNVASLKILKRNGFSIEKINENNLLLSCNIS